MLEITQQARSELRAMLKAVHTRRTEEGGGALAFRLVIATDPTAGSGLGLTLDERRDGDEVYDYDGMHVLLIDDVAMEIVDDLVLDVIEPDVGRRLRLRLGATA